MKCPACGRENRTSAGFCAWCGGRLGAQADKPSPGAAAAGDTTQAPQSLSDSAVTEATLVPAAPILLPPAPSLEVPPVGESTPAEPAAIAVESAPSPAAPTSADVGKTPLKPGDRVSGRFEIVEVLESSPERNRYRARDLCRCATCGYDDNTPEDDYCRDCGASMEIPAYATLLEIVHQPPEQYDVHLSEGERQYYATAEPKPDVKAEAEATTPPPTRLRLDWGRATDKGLQRDHNEDYLEVWLYAQASGGLLGLFVVADGLGGQDSGEVASRLTTDTVWQVLRASVWEPIIRGEALEPALLEEKVMAAAKEANRAVYEARTARGSEMNSTLTMALVVQDTAYVANVGDSRTYVWNAQGLQRISKDHSLVQRLVDTGMIAAGDVYTHPQRNLIYQSIGDRPDVRPDVYRRALAPDDRLILCSDGLWEMVRDEGLEEVLLAETDPQRGCERLVKDANLAGGEDNISVIVVRVAAA